MLTAFIMSFIVMIIAVELNLSVFDNAPLQYLCVLCLMSAHAMSGMAQILVRLSPKSSSLTSLVSGCISIGATVAAGIINITLYREQGSWPTALSLIPFFAQVTIALHHHNHIIHDIEYFMLIISDSGCICLVSLSSEVDGS